MKNKIMLQMGSNDPVVVCPACQKGKQFDWVFDNTNRPCSFCGAKGDSK